MHSIWSNPQPPTSQPYQCLPQNWIPQEHFSIFLPTQTNISTFCLQRILSKIATDDFATSIQPYASQPSLSTRTDLMIGDLICHMDAFHNLKPTYTSLPLCTSWYSILCSTQSPLMLQALGIPNNMVWTTNSGYTKKRSHILVPVTLNVPNHIPTTHTQPIKCNIIPRNTTMIP